MAQTIPYTQVTDIALDVNGDWLIGPSPGGTDIQMIGDGPGLQQAVKIALQFFAGEWFLDLSAGVPWFQSILVKNPNSPAIQAIFRKAILMVNGITAVNSIAVTINNQLRSVAIAFQATGDLGQLVSGNVAVPFPGETN